MRLTLWGASKKKVQIIAVSLGGGSFEITDIERIPVSLSGDLYELLVFTKNKPDLRSSLQNLIPAEVTFFSKTNEDVILYGFKSSYPLMELLPQLNNYFKKDEIAIINPIMPVIAGRQSDMPFTTLQSLIDYADKKNADLDDVGLIYEKCNSGMDEQDLKETMNDIIKIVHKSIDTGLSGTHYADRILHQQSHLIAVAEKAGKIKDAVINRIIANVVALMESKSAMEVVVAFPTAGSCGAVGGVLRAISENISASNDELNKAYFAAGIVGAYFAQGPGFSAEEHGCQVECGAASGMAAAGIVQLLGGTAKQALDAASMALQNIIGMVCDPVADRVEVPCLGKNINAAVNAYASAIMAVSGFDAVIPLDQVIQTISEVSKTMPTCIKCTGKGGLAMTEAALMLKIMLQKK